MGLAMKAVVVSTGVVSMAVMLKLSQPVILDFLTYELPLFWSFSLSWLRPPYLYLLINCIILSIVASSKLAGNGDSPAESPAQGIFPGDAPMKSAAMAMDEREEEDVAEEVVVFGYVDDDKASHLLVREEMVSVGDEEEEREHVAERERDPVVVYSPVPSSAEKPPVSARFSNRRSVKASPEGKAKLKVSRPKRQETLESTWRTITEGRPMPLTRHLRKSDTFSGGGHDASSPVRVMKKSESGGAWDSGNSSPASCGSGGKLKREASLSQDELNRRVEAFIKKFNEEMRMQSWQESLNHYREVVGHGGAHEGV